MQCPRAVPIVTGRRWRWPGDRFLRPMASIALMANEREKHNDDEYDKRDQFEDDPEEEVGHPFGPSQSVSRIAIIAQRQLWLIMPLHK